MGHCIFIRYLRFPRTLWIIIIPLIFSPLLLNKSPPLRCLYGVFVIAALWVTEVVPLAVTSLLPILIFPLLGLITSKEICMNYIKDASVLFICTLMLSLAVENCKLHRRIALFMLSKIGGKPIFLIMGMLGTSAIISIWISDTAATSLMVPIAIAVTETIIRNPLEIQKKDERSRFEQTPREQLNWNQRSTSEKALLKAMMLSCSHGSLIGGTTMLTSTGPNLVFKEKIYEALGEKESGITFLTWIFFTLPPLTFYLLASLFSMQMVFFGPKSFLNIFRRTTQDEEDRANAIRAAIKVERSQLQPVSFAELSVLGWFMLLIIGWITRNPGFVEGWGELLFGSKSHMCRIILIYVGTACLQAIIYVWRIYP
ncbi:hypothetical protein AB6A40_005338 [Gnathostoma spinigerum]|uniref:Solute carrier family 13 member 2 n=1 Tax=Gnathostoma spinigerum TaxID=75299 RepID=A0ABD6EF59_9BILA